MYELKPLIQYYFSVNEFYIVEKLHQDPLSCSGFAGEGIDLVIPWRKMIPENAPAAWQKCSNDMLACAFLDDPYDELIAYPPQPVLKLELNEGSGRWEATTFDKKF